MEVVLKKMGNSTGLVLPPAVLRALGVGVGSSMRMQTTTDGKLVLESLPKYRLSEMIAQCDLKASAPKDVQAWDAMPSVGGEAW